MKKPIAIPLLTLAAGGLILVTALAQQNPAPSTPQTPPPKRQPAATAKTAHPPAAKAPAELTLKTQKDKVSYAIGLNIGKSLQKDSVDVDPAIVARGMRDGLSGAKTLLSDEEVRSTLTAFQSDMRQKQQEKMEQLDQTNKKAGEEFLAANKTKEGVVALPSGLQYKVLKSGSGPKPAATDKVSCNYKGAFLDGKEFDSSERHGGKPVTFGVSEVIKAWTEALQLMPVGSKWQLFVPSDMAYGPRGAGQEIGPNKALIFEVELVSIEPKAEAKPEAAKPDAARPDASKPEAKP